MTDITVQYVDAPDAAERTARRLERADDRFTVRTAAGVAEAAEAVRTGVDCVVAAHDLPDGTGLDLLERVRASAPDLPFILRAADGSEAVASEAVSAGVTDYLRADGAVDPDRLADRIAEAVAEYRGARDRHLEMSVLQAAGDGVYALDLDGRITMVNDTLLEWTGHSRAELIDSHASAVFDDADVAEGRAVVRSLLDGDRDVGRFEGTLRGPDGDTRPVEIRLTLLEEGDEVRGTAGVVRDISDRRARIHELERYEAIFEQLEDAVYVLDEDERIVYVNDSYAEMKGADREELLGAPIVEWAHGATIEKVRRVREQIAAGEREVGTVENVFITADGEEIPAELRLINLSWEDGPTERVGVIRDITDRVTYRRRLEALSRSARQLMTAEDRAEVARIGAETARDVLGLEINGVYLQAEGREALVPEAITEAATELFGDAPTFTPGDSIAWRVYRAGEARAVDDVHADPDLYNPESPIRGELLVPIGDHGVLVAGSRTPESFDERDLALGEILASNLAAALDQVESRERLRQREAELKRQNDRLDAFAGVVSHDLRNPLNVARSRLELAATECDSAHLDRVDDALDRSQALIDDLLTLAREGETATDLAPVELADLVASCWTTVETGEATLDVGTDLTVRAVEGRLKQLFENLFRNAVEHGGSDVRIEVGDLPDGFYVADDGPGIPPDQREEVLEPGHSTSESGTGFGLSIVQGIVDAHGWELTVAGSRTGGARFEITGVETGQPAAGARREADS